MVAAIVTVPASGSETVRRAGNRQATDEVLTKLKAFERTGELGTMGSLLGERIDQAVDQSRAEGLAEGLAKGMEEGQRAMLLRLAARRFDADTATRLEELLAAIDDPDHLAAIGDHVIDSDDGEELLSRVAAERH